jgi:hypothetical protein
MRFGILTLLLLFLLFFSGCKVNISGDKFSVEWKAWRLDISDKEFKIKSIDNYETEITEDKFRVESKDWIKVEISGSWLYLDLGNK